MSDSLNVTTDKADYQPGETAVFTASNVELGGTVSFAVAHVTPGADGIYGTDDDQYTYDLVGTGITWSVTDGGEGDADGVANGVVTTSWYVNSDALWQTFQLTATDEADGETATANFTDAHTPVPASPASLANGLVIVTGDTNTATGTGIFPSFVQIQGDKEGPGSTYDNDGDDSTEEGFNTDAAPVLDTNNSAEHNHSIIFAAIPLVDVGGKKYYEFRLDINDGGNTDISLDSLKLYFSSDNDLTDLTGATLIYDMDVGVDVSIDLTSWASGSGHSDYKFLIPESYFTTAIANGLDPGDFIYLYSAFSDANSGFEEWSVGPVTPNPSVTIDKSAEIVGNDLDGKIDDAVQDDVEYTIVVTNTGNVALTGVVVSDKVESYASVPLGVPGAAAAGVTIVESGNGIHGNATLDVGEVWTYTFTYDVQQADIDNSSDHDLDNTATVDTTQTPPVSDTAAVPIFEGPGGGGDTAAMEITKTPDVSSVDEAGDVIHYTITVENTGNVALTGIIVSDPLLGGTLYLAGDADQDGTHDALENWSADGDTNNNGALDVGETWTYSASYTVKQYDLNQKGIGADGIGDGDGDIDNTASADSDQVGPETASAFVNIVYNPDYTIDKTVFSITNPNSSDGGTKIDQAGDVVTYHIAIENTGNVDLTGVTVEDKVESYAGVAASYLSGDTHNAGVLDVDETWIFSVTYTVVQEDINKNGYGDAEGGDGLLDNTATVSSDQVDDKSDSASVEIVYNPDYSIDKTVVSIANPDTTDGGTKIDEAGDIVTYKIEIKNTGNVDLTGVSVSDKVESYAGVAASYASGDTHNAGVLDVDETWIYSVTYTAVQADINNDGYGTPAGGKPGDGFLDNTATVSSDQVDDKSDSASVEIVYNPDYTIDKTVVSITNPDNSDGGTKIDQAGDVVAYQIEIENTGNVDLTGVSVSDKVESYAGVAASYVSGDTHNAGVLDVDETWIYSVTYTVVQADINSDGYGTPAGGKPGDGFLDNTATVSSDQVDDKSDSASVEIVYNPDLDISKVVQSVTGGHADQVGDIVTYKIEVDNVGNVDLTGVVVKDQVEGHAQITLDTNHSTVTTDDDAVLTGDDGDGVLEVNETWTYTYKYKLTQTDLNDADSRLYNTATADSDQTGPEDDTAWIDLGPGVRTQGFWSQKTWTKFWDGIANNEPSQKGTDGFANGDITRPPYANADTPGQVKDPVGGAFKAGILVGDWDLDGVTDPGEHTFYYSQDEALAILTSPPKSDGQDARYIMDRQLITAWLNYQAGNPVVDPNEGGSGDALDAQDMINWAIAWLEKVTPDENGNGLGDGKLAGTTKTPSSSSYWSAGIDGGDVGNNVDGVSPVPMFDAPTNDGDIPAGNTIATYLDEYNNHGTILGVHIATV